MSDYPPNAGDPKPDAPDTPDNPSAEPVDEQGLLDNHNYDGIQEYDNPIPGWWKQIFLATIIFSPLYVLWFHAPGMERDLLDQYDRAYAANLEQQFGEIGELTPDAQTILKYSTDEKWLAVGKATYKANCVSCHGTDAQGLSGPNLTDEAYINIDQATDFIEVLNNGARNGAMPAWGNRLHPNAVVLTASWLASIRGTNAPGGKAPEGDIPPPWGEQE